MRSPVRYEQVSLILYMYFYYIYLYISHADFSDMKHQNAERLEEEQKKYRETVDKIQRQAENEIEFLKMR